MVIVIPIMVLGVLEVQDGEVKVQMVAQMKEMVVVVGILILVMVVAVLLSLGI